MIRKFLLLFCILAAVFCAQNATAQSVHELLGGKEKPAQESAPEADAPAAETPAPAEPKNYTQKQLEEKAGFADYCATDAYLSRHYDCFCLAEEYIDKRVELGDAPGSADIIASLSKNCLFEARAPVSTEGVAEIDMSTLTDEQIKEMQDFYDGCTKDEFVGKAFDCECRAARYMEKRLELGPTVNRSAILLQIQGQCPNAEGAAQLTYDACINSRPNPFIRGTHEEYCECYANNYAKMFVQNEGISSRMASNLKARAQLMCMDLPIQFKPITPQ